MNENNFIGNFTTIVKTLLCMVAGWFIGAAASKGLNLPFDEQTLAEIMFSLLCLGWAYLDAKYPNTFPFLHNNKGDCECFIADETELINPDYYEED